MNNTDLSNKFITKYNSDNYFKNLVINKFGEQFPKPNKFTNFTKLGNKLVTSNISSKCSGDSINRRNGWGWTGEHGASDRGVKCCSLFENGQFGHNIGDHKNIKHKSDHPACGWGWSGRKKKQDIDKELEIEDWETWSKILRDKKPVPDWYPERPTKGSRRIIRRTKKLPLPPLRVTKKQQRQQEHNIILKEKRENENAKKLHEERWLQVKNNLINSLTKKQLKKEKNKRKKDRKSKKPKTSSGEGVVEQENVDEINAILQQLENPNTHSGNNGNNAMETTTPKKKKKSKKGKKPKKGKKAKKPKKVKKAKKSKKKNRTNESQPNNNFTDEPNTPPITSFINHYK